MANLISAFFGSPVLVFAAAFLLRAVLLVYGLWQDANSPLKYTDIDYLVFTDAARLTFSSSSASSPYARETYRYTPVLAWMLYPTTLPGAFFFSSGKVLFAAADLAAGWLLVAVLRRHGGLATGAALRYASIWLLNPMVATISTRGSSEGLLGVLVAALLYAVLERRVAAAAVLLGLGVHFKIYPFIYAPAIVWWMDGERVPSLSSSSSPSSPAATSLIQRFVTPARLRLALVSLATFAGLNLAMYALYGHDFLQHTFLHHVTRIDHRHNFSPYNMLLYLASAQSHLGPAAAPLGLKIESVAFVPQLLLSCVLIPLVGAKKDLPTTMLAQTFAFVTFNKVCTSQVRCRPMPHPLPWTRMSLLTLIVFPMVHDLPAAVSAKLVAHPPARLGSHCSCIVGGHPGAVVAAGLQSRVPRPEHLCSWAVLCVAGFLLGQLLDTGHHRRRSGSSGPRRKIKQDNWRQVVTFWNICQKAIKIQK